MTGRRLMGPMKVRRKPQRRHGSGGGGGQGGGPGAFKGVSPTLDWSWCDGQFVCPPGQATAPNDSMNGNLGVLWRYSVEAVTPTTS